MTLRFSWICSSLKGRKLILSIFWENPTRFTTGGPTSHYEETGRKKGREYLPRDQNTVEYITGKSFLFILLEEKLDLTLFCVRRSQNFISHTSLIFNVCPKRDTGASSTKVTRHLLLYTLSSWWARGFGQPVLCANRTFPKVAPRGKRTHNACLEGQVISLAYRGRVFIFIFDFIWCCMMRKGRYALKPDINRSLGFVRNARNEWRHCRVRVKVNCLFYSSYIKVK